MELKNETRKLDVKYAGEALDEIPAGYIDKQICACGFTSIALENNVPTVIAVPSQELINNKVVQYPNDRTSNTIFPVMSGVTVADVNQYASSVDVPKIITTYDSLWKTEHLLNDGYHLVVDESNKLLSYSKLKSTDNGTGKDVISKLFDIAETHRDTVSFISATPIPLEYMPEWVSTIDQINYEWSNVSTRMPIELKCGYPKSTLVKTILSPMKQEGFFISNGVHYEKAIIFMNSVKAITDVIKASGLEVEDVAIIAGNNVKNDVKIGKYFRLKDPSNLPQFTFSTSSGFDGIDLYDRSAVSIVVSNVNKKHTIIDKYTDLKQAISRQRDKKNPHYGKYIHIFNEKDFAETDEEFLAEIDALDKRVRFNMSLWKLGVDEGLRGREEDAMYGDLFNTYTWYNKDTNLFEMNEMLFKSDKYFATEVRSQYRLGVALRNGDTEQLETASAFKSPSYRDVAENYKIHSDFIGYEDQTYFISLIKQAEKLYGKVFLSKRNAEDKVQYYGDTDTLLFKDVRNSFKVGERYTSEQIKDILNRAYDDYDLARPIGSVVTKLQMFDICVDDDRINKERGWLVTGKGDKN